MKKLLLLLFLLPLVAFAQRDSVYIKTDIFTSVYSEVLQQPKWVAYTVQCPTGTAPRTGMDFYVQAGLITSDNNDYANNIYDKGHCAPAADFNCTKELLYKTFTYANCVLQHERLNRGVWRLLESYERELAKTNTVSVEIRMVYSTTSLKLPTGATVPDGFYKIIKVGNKTEKYYFPNTSPTSSDFKTYLIK
jgi:endonuclease G, mitochondrial